MKFCYFDESGMGNEPVLVMAGVIVDAQRMHQTKTVWSDFLESLSQDIGRKVTEFHAGHFYRGSGPWGKIDGPERAQIISAILNWIEKRKHRITFSAIDKGSFSIQKERFIGMPTEWAAAAFHCILGLQKHHKQHDKNKGHTVVVFDRAKGETGLSKLVIDPPEWTCSFYGKDPKEVPLNQIVDVPYFADSEQALLIQVADMISYILRTYAELVQGSRSEEYKGEYDRMKNWVDQIINRAIPQAMRYPPRGRCQAAQNYWNVAPECLRR